MQCDGEIYVWYFQFVHIWIRRGPLATASELILQSTETYIIFSGRPHMDSSLFSRGSRCRWVTQLWWLLLLSSIWIRSFLCFWEFEDLLLCLSLSWTIQGQGADLVIFFLFWIIEVVIRTGGFGPSLLIRLKQEIGKIISWVPFLRCQTKREF